MTEELSQYKILGPQRGGLLHADLSLGSFLRAEDVPPKRWLTFNGLQGVISPKMELFN
jgi:hypothetical protein